MTLSDALRLGPLNLPVRYLLVFLSLAIGYLIMSLALIRRSDARKTAANRMVNSVLIFLVVWKLEPLVAEVARGLVHGRTNWGSVWFAIFLPGGMLATIVGAAAAAVYLITSIVRAGMRPLLQAAALATALLPAALTYSLGVVLLAPHAPTGSGLASRAAGAAVAAPAPVGTAIGDRAPGFAAETLAGTRLELSGPPGKTIVLNFWATWCPPCRAELPELVRFAASGHRRPIEVWAVNLTSSQSDVGAVRSFSLQHHLDFPVLLDRTGAIAHAYGIQAVPTTLIISPAGRVIAKQIGAMSPGWLHSQTTN